DGTYTILADDLAPTGTSITQPPTLYVPPGSMAVNFNVGADQNSFGLPVGIDPARTTIQRRSAPVSAPVGATPPSCPADGAPAWSHPAAGAWTTVATNPSGSSFTDPGAVADPNS